MLEKIPRVIGRALRNVRPGSAKLSFHDSAFHDVPETIQLTSHAFADGEPLPPQHTADGEGSSPPLSWSQVPESAKSLVLLIEDADSPTPHPLVHALVWDLPPVDGGLASGELTKHTAELGVGRNSMFARTYMPPDPPRGHGAHHYAFQMFACDRPLDFESPPGRSALLDALRGHVLAVGCLVGTYERA
jgi:Raf kinase inhibitor-like YbhB/YbcL family protein